MCLHQGEYDAGDQDQMKQSSRPAGYNRTGYPCSHAIASSCEDQCLYNTGKYASAYQSCNEADIKVSVGIAGMHKLHDKTRYGTIDCKLYHHLGQDSNGRHSAERTGQKRTCYAAQKPKGPAAYQTTDIYRNMHRTEDLSGILDSMEKQGNQVAKSDAYRSNNGFLNI